MQTVSLLCGGKEIEDFWVQRLSFSCFVFVSLSSFSRRDPYDYPRAVSREPGPHSDAPNRLPIPQAATQPSSSQRVYPASPSAARQQQQRPALRQDVPPSPTVAYRGRQHNNPVGRPLEGYRQASPGRYTSPDRYGYSDDGQSEPRRKNPMIGAV